MDPQQKFNPDHPPQQQPLYPNPDINPPPGYGHQMQPIVQQPMPGYPQPGQPQYGGYPAPGQQPPPGYPYPGQQPGYPQPGQPVQGYPPTGQPMQGYPQPGQQFSNMGAPHPNQGGAPIWMPMPDAIPNCPPGLEYLAQIDQVLIHQQIEVFELISGFESENKYRIKNALGQDVYFAAEDSDFCSRNCFGSLRPFNMKVIDNVGREVIHFNRPCRCECCCCCCCLQTLEVQAPVGEIVGYVIQEWSLCYPSFTIRNANKDVVMRINGPCCVGCKCGDTNFHVYDKDGKTKVGRIQKQWAGIVQEAYSDADNFGITFPMDLDVRMKAVMMGACFLIDFMYFEQQQNQNR